MSQPILLVAVPAHLGPVLSGALSPHGALVSRDGVEVQRLHSTLEMHTRARVHSDKLPWDSDADWVDELVDAGIHRLGRTRDGRRTVWRAHSPSTAGTVNQSLRSIPLVWVADPRHALAPGAPDPVAAAALAGQTWAHAGVIARALPRAVDAEAGADAVLAALGLDSCATTRASLQLLRTMPAPTASGPVLAALAAAPPAEEALRRSGLGVPPLPDHPVPLLVRAQATPAPGDALRLARRALQLAPDPRVRGAALDVLIKRGAAVEAREQLVRWMRSGDAMPAWERLLTDRTGPPEKEWVQAALRHGNPAVRGALARWLVSHGLDRQGAETLCRVRDSGWFTGPQN